MKKEHAAGIILAYASRLNPESTTEQIIAKAFRMGVNALMEQKEPNRRSFEHEDPQRAIV